jgi:hypothetical protein
MFGCVLSIDPIISPVFESLHTIFPLRADEIALHAFFLNSEYSLILPIVSLRNFLLILNFEPVEL